MNEKTFAHLVVTIWRAYMRRRHDPSPANYFLLADALSVFERKLARA